jgi:arylformamidase
MVFEKAEIPFLKETFMVEPFCWMDISPTIHGSIAVFPGDTPFQRTVDLDFQKGDHLSLSHIQSTLHLGSHGDAPSHYHPQGRAIHEQDLGFYIGFCQVIDVSMYSGVERLLPSHLEMKPILSKRILFKTGSFPDPSVWTEHFTALSPELIYFLHREYQVMTVGIDTPSIDPATSKELSSHRALFDCDMAVIEGLELSHIEDGEYFLSAIPLKILGADGAPLRAVLGKKNVF